MTGINADQTGLLDLVTRPAPRARRRTWSWQPVESLLLRWQEAKTTETDRTTQLRRRLSGPWDQRTVAGF